MSKAIKYNPNYPSIDNLRTKAKKRIPAFAFEYFDGGCNEDTNIRKNTREIREVELIPQYLTCLLYTSPSPRDRQKSRMPSSA